MLHKHLGFYDNCADLPLPKGWSEGVKVQHSFLANRYSSCVPQALVPPSAWSPVVPLCDQGPTHASDGVLEGCVWQSSVPRPLLRWHLQHTCRLPFLLCT